MSDVRTYADAVQAIKTAILQSQYEAARSVNEKQLSLYFGIGKYISLNSRKGFWGKGAIDAISERLQSELPELRGFSARSLRDMRIFYEEWSMLDSTRTTDAGEILADASAKSVGGNLAPVDARTGISIWHPQVPNCPKLPETVFFRSDSRFIEQSFQRQRLWRSVFLHSEKRLGEILSGSA